MDLIAVLPSFALPYSFLKSIPEQKKRELLKMRWSHIDAQRTLRLEKDNQFVLAQFLPWDSQFFEKKIARVEGFHLDKTPAGFALLGAFEDKLRSENTDYVFALVPAEDVGALNVLEKNGWSLVESRVTFYRDQLSRYSPVRRYKFRIATEEDMPLLEETAALAKNPLDRFYGDSFYAPTQVEGLMREWIRASVRKKFADQVLVPEGQAHAFMTLRYLKEEWPILESKVSQLVLNAVHPRYPGWYPKLVVASLLHLKENGAETAFITTQAANRAVLRAWEFVGLQYGSATMVLRKILERKRK